MVNLSLGDASVWLVAETGTPLATGIEYAWSRGAIAVLAAGNYSVGVSTDDTPSYGNLDAVVVGATHNTGAPAWYSTPFGNAKWGVDAPGGANEKPGEGVASTVRGSGGVTWLAGTSMATPHVSAALAMLLAEGLDPPAAVRRLLDTLDTSRPCGTGCLGRLRVDAAVAPVASAAPARPPAAAITHPSRGFDATTAEIATVLALAVGAAAAVVVRRRQSLSGGATYTPACEEPG